MAAHKRHHGVKLALISLATVDNIYYNYRFHAWRYTQILERKLQERTSKLLLLMLAGPQRGFHHTLSSHGLIPSLPNHGHEHQ
jgi:hypothetical protein